VRSPPADKSRSRPCGSAAGPDCWPCLGTTGSKAVADRTLGFPAERPTACGKAMPDTDVATATPSPGFEAGETTGSIDGCCALCDGPSLS